MSATARDMEDSPNPDFNRPIHENPAEVQAKLHAYHKEAGTLGDYYDMYPGDRPWDYGLTPEVRAAMIGRSRER